MHKEFANFDGTNEDTRAPNNAPAGGENAA